MELTHHLLVVLYLYLQLVVVRVESTTLLLLAMVALVVVLHVLVGHTVLQLQVKATEVALHP
jgi:hypothetical protein